MNKTRASKLARADGNPTARPLMLSVWLFTLVLLVGAAVGWIVIAPKFEPLLSHPWPWWFFVALFVLAKQLRVDLAASGTQPISLVMTDAAVVVALLLADQRIIPVAIASAAVVHGAIKRSPIIKLAFNVSQELAGACLGLIAFDLTRGHALVSAQTGFAALLGGAVIGLFSHRAVDVVTRLAGGAAQRTPLRSLALSSLGSIGNGVVALQAVYLGTLSPLLTAIPALLLVVLGLGYRSIRVQQQTADRTELLYKTTSALHEQPNMDEALLRVLEEVRVALRCHTARIVLLASEGAVTCAATNDHLVPMTAATGSEEAAAQRLAADLPGATLLRTGTPATRSGPASVFASDDAILAPVVRGSDPAGIVIVSGRVGGPDHLAESDLDLVDLLAKQIGLALEKGFLERSLRQLLELEQQLTRQAYFDAVTGLANRNYLNDELDRVAGTVSDMPSALLLVDLDDFKTVNDSLGHVAGDRLLAAIAQRLLDVVGERGLVTRIGGDEFAILIRNVPDSTGAVAIAEQIIEVIPVPVPLDIREVGVGASIGIRLTNGNPDETITLLRDADLALYNAKAQGKGRAALFRPEMHKQAEERLVLTSALANAVERDEFALVFQPIVNLDTRSLAGVEALVRWRHPERGEIGPTQFLSLTEESGLIVVLGRNILRQALTALSGWLPIIGHDNFYVSVNVSARQLREPNFAATVLDLLRQYRVPARHIVLEITESMLIDDVVRTKAVLEELTEIGIRFSLDDFGTGYSSLSQIQQLPFHQLKIDQSFVRRLGSGRDTSVVIRAIVQLAEAMGLDAVAEGIELEPQLTELRRLGCAKGQGWLFSKAVSSDQVADLLTRERIPSNEHPTHERIDTAVAACNS